MNFLAALGFLSSIPVGRRSIEGRSLAGSAMYFPLVGLVLGFVLAGVDYGLRLALPNMLTSAMDILLLVLLTGALHFEGFVDSCDGLIGGHTRERRLEIMRMKNVGAYAVAGGALLLILKFAAVASLPYGWSRFWALALFPMLSRWGMALVLSVFPYARTEGLGMAFRGVKPLHVVAAGATAFAVAGIFGSIAGIILFALATIIAILMGMWVTKLVGGLTGDTYGATNEICEIIVLITAVGIIPMSSISLLPVWQVVH